MDADDTVRLRVPAASGHLGTARIFGAAAGRRFGADEEAVADVRLAVSEACTIALQASRGAGAIVLSVRPVPGGLAAEIRTERELGEVADDAPGEAVVPRQTDPADGWGVELLQAMVSELSFEPGVDGQIVVSFVVPYAGHAAVASLGAQGTAGSTGEPDGLGAPGGRGGGLSGSPG